MIRCIESHIVHLFWIALLISNLRYQHLHFAWSSFSIATSPKEICNVDN